jgi:hypothetical protein
MLMVIQSFDKHYSCHLQGDYIVPSLYWLVVLEDMCRVGSGRSVGCVGSDCWNGIPVCCLILDENIEEENR